MTYSTLFYLQNKYWVHWILVSKWYRQAYVSYFSTCVKLTWDPGLDLDHRAPHGPIPAQRMGAATVATTAAGPEAAAAGPIAMGELQGQGSGSGSRGAMGDW